MARASTDRLTALEKHEAERNGWTPEQLEQYRADRDRAANRVAGNFVTEFKPPRPPLKYESAMQHKPHRWGRP